MAATLPCSNSRCDASAGLIPSATVSMRSDQPPSGRTTGRSDSSSRMTSRLACNSAIAAAMPSSFAVSAARGPRHADAHLADHVGEADQPDVPHDLFGACDPADPPADHPVFLGDAADGHGPLGKSRQPGRGAAPAPSRTAGAPSPHRAGARPRSAAPRWQSPATPRPCGRCRSAWTGSW